MPRAHIASVFVIRALLSVCALTACRGAPAAERIVLITIDTLRADHVGAYGSRSGATPTLDALAEAGVRFETTVSPTPLTLPSHTTILSGLDPPRHGVHDNSVFRVEDELPLLAETLRDAGFATAAFVGAVVLDQQYGLARGFDHYDDRMALRRAAGDVGFAERPANEVIDAAIAWLASAPPRFFLWVHLYDPHADYQPPEAFAARLPTPYLGEIAFADAEVGRLLRALSSRFGAGTTIAVTSDHGESLGEHGELSHALTIYDATQKVPWILAGDGVPEGHVVGGVARLADVAPTLAALAGARHEVGVDGHDLSAALATTTLPEDSAAYVETLATRYTFHWSPIYGLRTVDWKYVLAPRPELYDLRADPGETRNLARDQPERVAALDARLRAAFDSARPVVANRSVDAAGRARLEALGYVAADPANAGLTLGDVSGMDPKDGLAYLATWRSAFALRAAGRPEQALERLRPFREGGPFLDLMRADVALEAEAWTEAEGYVRAALAGGVDRSSTWIALGEALLSQGRAEEAESAFREALERDDAAADPHVGFGRLAERRSDLAAARAHYERALEARGGSIEGHWRLAALELEAGDDAAANALLKLLPKRERLRYPAVRRLCRADLAVGAAKRAQGRVRRALVLRPGHPQLVALRDRLAAGEAP